MKKNTLLTIAGLHVYICMAGVASAADQPEPITTGSLVREMIDLRRFCEFPSPTFKTIQFSSYDRRSDLPNGPGWFANSDGFGKEPVPNFESVLKLPDDGGQGEYVICDVKGPGAIVRVWTARIKGTIRLYLDGADEPIFDGEAREFLQRTWHQWAQEAGIDEKVLEGTFRQRDAGYYPIPFAKGCKIIYLGDHREIHFYQVQIRQYEPSAKVVTFAPADIKTYKADIEMVAQVLCDPDARWAASAGKEIPIEVTLEPGKKVVAVKLDGPGLVERLTVKVQAQRLDQALRQTVMQIVCDDFQREQVESPIGDFFGAAPGVNPFVSLPFTVRPDGTMTSRFVMPYAKNLTLIFHNRGDQDVKITGSLLQGPYAWDDARSMYFQARWRANHNLIASSERVQDVPYLVGRGRGVFVGCSAFLLNPCTIPSHSGSWWGEGDEKVFIDDDVRPSTFGTGSEDYFNYAWSSADIFLYPYCGQPRNDGPANNGFVTNFRWQIVDCMPFRQSFAFYMELYPHTTVPGFSYCRTAYHYARPGMMDDLLPIAPEDLRHLEMKEEWQPEADAGARHSKFYAAEDLIASPARISFRKGRLYAGGQLMVWQPEASGDTLSMTVPIDADGSYVIRFIAGLDDQSGRFSATLDGRDIGFKVIDLYAPHRVLSRVFDGKPQELKQGEHALVLHYEGPSPAGAEVERPIIGLDYLWVQVRK